MKLRLLKHQMEMATSTSLVTVGAAGRGAGKSLVAGAIAATKLKNGLSGLLIAPIFDDCSVIVNYIEDFLRDSHTAYQHNRSKHFIKLKRNGATLFYRTGETEKGIRGKTNLSFMIVDEAAQIPYEIYLIAKACLRGAKVRSPQIYLISTPRGKGNWLYEEAMKPSTKLVMASTRDNTLLDSSFYEELKSSYSGDFAAQELEAAWVDSSAMCVYSDSEWELFSSPLAGINQASRVVVGLDVAAGGDNSSACVIRGNEVIRIHSAKTTLEMESLISLVRTALGGLAPDVIIIDSTGVGTFAPAEFKKAFAGAEVFGVNFADKAYRPGYTNRRDEIHFDLKKRIEKGLRLHPSISQEMRKQLQKQMLATDYMISGKSDFKLVPKKEIKSKIGSSPDELDSVVLAASVDAESIGAMRAQRAPVQTIAITPRR